jgi:hypothetical protein
MTGSDWLRRVRRPVAAWALTALVTELVVEQVLGREPSLPPATRMAVALAPLLPSLLFVLALVRMVLHMDELQKLICLESVFVAFVGTLALAFVFSALQQAGVSRPPWDSVGEAMLVLWAVAYVYSSWKYR